jgi:modulator of FtsH protease
MSTSDTVLKPVFTSARSDSAISSNKVIRNTYLLLSMTLLFSAGAAAISVAMALPQFGILVTLAGYFGLLFLTMKLRNSMWGLASVFMLTGFMGLTLGPIINHYLAMSNGAQTVSMAMGATAIVFISLSAYALISRKDFSFMSGFLLAGIIVAFVASLAAVFLEIPALALTVSAAMVLLMSGLILFETSNIIHGGETNYIMATVSLFVSIFNLFTSLLHLLGFANSSE